MLVTSLIFILFLLFLFYFLRLSARDKSLVGLPDDTLPPKVQQKECFLVDGWSCRPVINLLWINRVFSLFSRTCGGGEFPTRLVKNGRRFDLEVFESLSFCLNVLSRLACFFFFFQPPFPSASMLCLFFFSFFRLHAGCLIISLVFSDDATPPGNKLLPRSSFLFLR